MDDYQQKLSTGNVFIQTQAVSALYGKIISSSKDGVDVAQSPEVCSLYQSARCGNTGEASVAVTGLVALVKDATIPAVSLLSNLLADVLTAKCPAPSVQAITRLLLLMCEKDWSVGQGKEGRETTPDGKDTKVGELINPFTGPPTGPVSPYVTLVRKKPELAELVIDECGYLLNHPDLRVRSVSVSIVSPLVLCSACLSDVAPLQLLTPLLHMLHDAHCCASMQHGEAILTLLLRAAQLARCSSPCEVQRKVSLLCTVAAIAERDGNAALQRAMLPALATALVPAQEHGVSVRGLVRQLSPLVAATTEGCDVTLAALATAIPSTTTTLLPTLLRYCGQLVSSGSSSNPVVCCSVLPSVLQVLSAPCTIAPSLTAAAAALATLVQHKRPATSDMTLPGNPYWPLVRQMFPILPGLLTMVEVCNRLVSDPRQSLAWLSTLASSPAGGLSRVNRLVVTAVFLYQASPPEAVVEAAKVLERSVVQSRSGALELFPLLLYRLGRDRQPTTRLTILHLLPSLANNKLCVSLVLKALYTLWSSPPLRPVILRVAYDLWRVEARVYPHLLRLLSMAENKGPGPHDGELSIARAYVIAAVCKDKPSQHGEELLPLLSSLLNQNSSSRSVSYSTSSASTSVLISSAVCCFALDAITDLINGGVIDLRTTWRVLAPQLAKDKRPEVLNSLCSMLALAAKLQVKSEEYETFTGNILNILWSWANHQNKCVSESAYKALEEFSMTSFRLKMLPQYARQGIKLPDSMAATPYEAARRPEDVLTYVPGEAWVNLVRGAKASHYSTLEPFVRSLIRREVASLYKGIYLTAIQEAKKRGLKGSGGQPEPLGYDFMKDFSTLKATVSFLQNIPKELHSCSTKDEGDKIINTLLIFLKGLGQPLNRPYPALDWILLTQVQDAVKEWCQKHAKIDWDEKIRHAIFDILSKQCNKSASASAYISKFLVPSSANELTQRDEIHLFGLMDYLGRGIPPATLQPFISFTFNRYIADTNHLKLLLDAVNPLLTSEFIHDTNRNGLGNAIEGLNEKIDPTNSSLYSSYKSCVADLPSKHIERLTSPSLWWEVTDERLYRAAVLRCHVALKDPEDMALPWLNDIVDSAASLPGERTALLKVLAETLTVRCKDKESTAWFLQLLGQLLDQTKKKIPDNLVANHEHNQRLLFYADLLIITLVIWSGNYINYGIEKIVETPSLCNKLLTPSIHALFERSAWESTLPQLLNFLVSSFSYLKSFLSSRYDLAPSTVLMANLCPSLSQQMWNKVVTLNIKHSESSS